MFFVGIKETEDETKKFKGLDRVILKFLNKWLGNKSYNSFLLQINRNKTFIDYSHIFKVEIKF